jgi:hypothetical protein
MVLGKLDIHMQMNETVTKIKSKWIKILNERTKTIKPVEVYWNRQKLLAFG